MSAFMVSFQHIDAILAVAMFGPEGTNQFRWRSVDRPYFRDLPISEDNVEAAGDSLIAENWHSVHYRYPDSYGDDFAVCLQPYFFRWDSRPSGLPDVVGALKLIDCYEYQACEHPEWKDSSAKEFCSRLRASLISWLPGWDAAKWATDAELGPQTRFPVATDRKAEQ